MSLTNQEIVLELKKHIPDVVQYVEVRDDETLEEFNNRNSVRIRLKSHYKDRTFSIDRIDWGGKCYRIRCNIYDIRDTEYKSFNKAIIRRISKYLEEYKLQIESETDLIDKVNEEKAELQEKIDKYNHLYNNCIEMHQESEYDMPFPYVKIGNSKYLIDMEKEVVAFEFNTANIIRYGVQKFPAHLAIPFLQEVELNKLLEN